jgi:hypothetical protein
MLYGYDPDSIMHYCRDRDRDGVSDVYQVGYTGDWALSYFDAKGVAVVASYGQRFVHFTPDETRWAQCTDGIPCYAGGGDCDNDRECFANLVCKSFSSTQNHYTLEKNVDVCVDPTCPDGSDPTSPNWSPDCRIEPGSLGNDCDNDAECGPYGMCMDNIGKFVHPDAPSTLDLCVYQPRGCNKYVEQGEDWSACTESCPCDLGQGDCDNDNQCRGELVCKHNQGTLIGKSSSFDLCGLP